MRVVTQSVSSAVMEAAGTRPSLAPSKAELLRGVHAADFVHGDHAEYIRPGAELPIARASVPAQRLRAGGQLLSARHRENSARAGLDTDRDARGPGESERRRELAGAQERGP